MYQIKFKRFLYLNTQFAEKIFNKIAPSRPNRAILNTGNNNENELGQMLEELFASVMTLTDAADPERLIHQKFRLLPSEKQLPDYYKIIGMPTL